MLVETRNRTVIDHLSIVVAPTTVSRLADLELGDVPHRNTRQKRGGIRPHDLVLEERGNIDDAGGMADGVVFAVDVGVIRANRVGLAIALPVCLIVAILLLLLFFACVKYRYLFWVSFSNTYKFFYSEVTLY